MNGSNTGEITAVIDVPGGIVKYEKQKLQGKQTKQPWFYVSQNVELICDVKIFLYRQRFNMLRIGANNNLRVRAFQHTQAPGEQRRRQQQHRQQ